MTEPTMGSLTGYEVAGNGAVVLGRHLDVSGWGRYRELLDLPRWSVNGGVGARLRAEQHGFAVRWTREDVDTVPAQVQGIMRQLVAGTYTFNSSRWRAEAEYARFTYEDGNLRNDVQATVLRRLGTGAHWQLGVTVSRQDSRFDPAEYYAPRNLLQAMARVNFRQNWGDASSLAVEVGAGGARDPVNDLRPSGFGRLRFSRWWGSQRRLGTSIEVQGRAVPTYQSFDTTFRLDIRL
jgi:hypothetical protein